MTSRPGWTPLLVGGVVVGPLDDVAAVGGAAAGHIRHLARAPGLELAVPLPQETSCHRWLAAEEFAVTW